MYLFVITGQYKHQNYYGYELKKNLVHRGKIWQNHSFEGSDNDGLFWDAGVTAILLKFENK